MISESKLLMLSNDDMVETYSMIFILDCTSEQFEIIDLTFVVVVVCDSHCG